MNAPFSRLRRFQIAAIALVFATALFRSQIALSLVVRGDDLVYRGQVEEALEHYERALWLDPDLSAAADRYAFISLRKRDSASLHRATAVADALLKHNPDDADVLADRGMCYLAQRRYRAARRDFERAARLQSNASAYVFAGWAAHHAGEFADARTLWRRALRLDPRFKPAKIALAEHAL